MNRCILTVFLFSAVWSLTAQQDDLPYNIRFLDEYILEDSIFINGKEIGGLSSIDYINGNWYIICDDSKSPRFYRANIRINKNRIQFVEFVKAIDIESNGDQPIQAADPEGLRILPKSKNLIWTSEGSVRNGFHPSIHEIDANGKHIRSIAQPSMFNVNDDEHTGPRHNDTFEGLTVSPNGKSIWVAMEGPLKEDGPKAQVKDTHSPIRVTRYNLKSGKSGKQFAYELDPVARPSINSNKTMVNGVTEILQISKREFLFIERSFSGGYDDGGLTVNIYYVNTKSATNVSKIKSLKQRKYKPAQKQLLLRFDDLRPLLTDRIVDNLEGICFGPTLPNGNRSLMVVSDNNFNAFGPQLNQFLLFEMIKR